MVEGKKKSRRFRRVYVRTPGGNNVIHYRNRKEGKVKCGSCGMVLKGTAHDLAYRIKNMVKSKKKPSRPYGGNLCSSCTREKLKIKARL